MQLPEGIPASTAPPKVAARRKGHTKRGGNRGRSTRIENDIQGTARARQTAWLESGKPYTTFRLTNKLGELYDDHRGEQAGTFIDPYRGRTSAVKP